MNRLSISVLCTAILCVAPLQAQTFIRLGDDSTGPIITDTFSTVGCSWADFDENGYPDLFVAETARPNFLYRNNGDVTFSHVTEGDIVERSGVYNLGLWGDYDNDDDLDVYVTNWASIDSQGGPQTPFPNYLYRNDGPPNYHFTRIDPSPGQAEGDVYVSYNAAWEDIDNDGDLDLFVPGNWFSRDAFFMNEGTGGFRRSEDFAFLAGAVFRYHVTFIDIDGDRDRDLYLVNTGRANQLYLNMLSETGVADFQRKADGPLVQEAGSPSHFDSSGLWFDADNDGDPDLLVSSYSHQARFYRNSGAGTFAPETGSALSTIVGALGATAGDFDNDGDLDVVIMGNGSSYFRNDGSGRFEKISASIIGDIANDIPFTSGGPCTADIDRDGSLDVFSAHADFAGYPESSAKPNNLFLNSTGSNNWVRIALKGTDSNRNGIGARIRISADIDGSNVRQFRFLTGSGNASGAQEEYVQHFGLRNAERIDTIRVEWPSGTIDEWHDVEVNGEITIVEGEPQPTDAESKTELPDQCLDLTIFPNPSAGRRTIQFALSVPGTVLLEVVDLLGRRVAVLASGWKDAGEHSVVFLEEKLRPGMYAVRFSAGTNHITRMVTIL